MINNLSVLALITARGGSKSVVGKNLRTIGDKSLIGWTMDAARSSRYIDRIIISTDNQDIIDHAKALGCEVPFMRPDYLATDKASSLDVVRHAMEEEGRGYDLMVLLQPTSPFRRGEDIDATIDRMFSVQARTCITVCKASKSPHWMFEIEDDGTMEPVVKMETLNKATRRQDLPPVYVINGAVYVAYIDDLLNGGKLMDKHTVAHIMSVRRSLDIDDEMDLKIAKALLDEVHDPL